VHSGGQRIDVGVSRSGAYAGDAIRGYQNLWLDAEGRVFIKAGFGTSAMDVAERFKAFQILELGEVVVIDRDHKEAVKPCDRAYDQSVIGIVSTEPGFILGLEAEEVPIALCGRVPCKVDADIAAIEVGDLLTTSPTPGHAQKLLDSSRAVGTVIGKALEPLEKGQGKILVFVLSR
ncbi:MAG: hypothetical protein VKJ24_15465, partial [Synechococcales bacterium]|nr:hypothetical protein [Synechococcales bacterium]